MLTKFDEKAKEAIVIAERIANDLGHSNVRSEHLLLSLLKMKDCPFSKILKTYDVDDEMIHEDVVRLFGQIDVGQIGSRHLNMEYSEVIKKILEDAVSMGEEKNESKVSLNTLSIVMLLQKGSIAVGLLNQHNVDIYKLLKQYDVDIEKTKKEESLKLKGCESFTEIINPKKEKFILKRDEEVQNIMIGLSCKDKSNIALLGKAGVGKTAVVEELARVLKTNPPKKLEGYQIVSFDANSAVAGTKYRGEFEEKIDKFLKAIKGKKVIVFIDEGHSLTSLGTSEGSTSLSETLKPILTKREYKFIIATTKDEYQQYIATNVAFARRFRQICIQEPKCEDVPDMIKAKVKGYKDYHKVSITKEQIREIVEMSRPIPDRCFPDKALDVIDYTMAYCSCVNEKDFNMEKAQEYIESLCGQRKEEKEILFA